MGEIIKFDVGCRFCEHLVQTGKGTYCCAERVHLDDTEIMPIVNNKKTRDWGACKGEDYVRALDIRARRRSI